MTVKDLICKLERMPKEATIIFPNSLLRDDGEFEVDSAEYFSDDNVVYITSKYKKNFLELE